MQNLASLRQNTRTLSLGRLTGMTICFSMLGGSQELAFSCQRLSFLSNSDASLGSFLNLQARHPSQAPTPSTFLFLSFSNRTQTRRNSVTIWLKGDIALEISVASILVFRRVSYIVNAARRTLEGC